MTIVFDCQCGRALRIRDENLRGQKVRCPVCEAIVDVPGEPKREPAAAPDVTPQQKPEAPKERAERVPQQKPEAPKEKAERAPQRKPEAPKAKEKSQSRKRQRRGGKNRRDRTHRAVRTGRGRDGLEPQERAPRMVGGGADSARPVVKRDTEDAPEKKSGAGSFLRRLFGR